MPTSQEPLQIPSKLWHPLLPSNFFLPSLHLSLSPLQSATLISSENALASTYFSPEQTQQINEFIESVANKSVSIKVNNRTPKDLPIISKQIHSVNDILSILQTSEYILENIFEDKPIELILCEWMSEIANNNNIYNIYVKDGYTFAIGQDVCDHVEEKLSQQTLQNILQAIQQIIAPITMISPQGSELNSFKVTSYCKEDCLKIIKITQFPPFGEMETEIFTQKELETYLKEIDNGEHKDGEVYSENEGIIPLIKVINDESEIKCYDMGEYLTGNEISNFEMLQEWKQFIEEAKGNIE